MSYQVLARKWRPSNFTQVAGQAHVLKSLVNALDNGRLHHAYLFTGTRGVGKTTLARILAKCLNCETGVTSTPCGECSSCIEISEGRFIDLIEVDAASRTKVEDTRELLDNVQYTPSRGRFKVYLIDEVHMLSTHSFNALLKTLEEPPPHVKFLFATTDPQKLPITVLSRCLQFNLKNLSPQQISEYLHSVLEQEQIEFAEDAIWQIAGAANGSMRDALTLVDQAISYCEGKIETAGVVEMLGIPEQQKVFALLEKMSTGSIAEVFALVQELAEHTPDYIHTLDGLLSVLHRVALAQVVPDAIDNSLGDKTQVQALAAALTAEDVQLYYQMGTKGRDDLKLSADSRAAFDMLLLRMLVFSPNYSLTTQPGTKTAAKDAGAKTESATEQDEVKAQATTANAVEEKKKNKTVAETSSVEEAKSTRTTTAIPAAATQKARSTVAVSSNKATAASDVATGTTKLTDLTHAHWLDLHKQMNIGGIVGNVLANSELLTVNEATLEFRLDQSQSAVFSDELIPKMEQAISAWFGIEVEVKMISGIVSSETPAMRNQRIKAEKHREMVSDFERDENVQELIKHFAGTLAKDSIAPLND